MKSCKSFHGTMLCQTLSMQLARKMLVLNPKGEDVLCHHHKDIAHQVLGGLRVLGSQGLSDLVVTE